MHCDHVHTIEPGYEGHLYMNVNLARSGQNVLIVLLLLYFDLYITATCP